MKVSTNYLVRANGLRDNWQCSGVTLEALHGVWLQGDYYKHTSHKGHYGPNGTQQKPFFNITV